jgi:hypothetical protein
MTKSPIFPQLASYLSNILLIFLFLHTDFSILWEIDLEFERVENEDKCATDGKSKI